MRPCAPDGLFYLSHKRCALCDILLVGNMYIRIAFTAVSRIRSV